MFKRLAGAFLLRRLTRDLSAISAALDRQNVLLARLVDHLCPAPPDDAPTVATSTDTGVTFLDPIEMGLSLDYIQKMRAATGHTPDDEEILVYLADEKTHDLHLRMAEREADLARLTAARERRR
jgi:hypothetical protein